MINNFLFVSLRFGHAFKLFNLRTYLILYVVISFYVVNTIVPLIPVYKQGVSAAPVVVFFSIRVFSVQCFVYHCLSFSPFSFDHYMVLPFDIQNLITPLL